ncbi:MAG: hypothetical protein WCJ36_03215 [Candidatus Saccharibacteria bacterium]
MGMVYENEAIGNIKGDPINFGTPERRIIVNVPDGIFIQLGILVEQPNTDIPSFQRFFELAVWLEQAINRYPDYFNDVILKTILTEHIQYRNHAVERNMLYFIKHSETFKDAMKVVFNRVGSWTFQNKELISLLDSKE